MAEFNPQVNDPNTPDFTSSSRGGAGDDSLGTLFSGIGSAVEQSVQTADQFVQNRIDSDARYGFEGLNDEVYLSSDVVPQEITRTQQGLSELAAAHVQGKITSEYYYHRLSSTMKGLRAKYPGYEKEVDQIVQNVTGERPANAFRNALMQNIANAENSARTSSDKDDTYVRNNSKYLTEDQIMNPERYGGTSNLVNIIQVQKSREYANQVADTQVKSGQIQAAPELNKRFNILASETINSLSDALGFNSKSGSNIFSTLNSNGLSPEARTSLLNSLDVAIENTSNSMIKAAQNDAFIGLPIDEVKRQREAALQPLRDIRDKISSKDYNSAAILAENLKMKLDQVKSNLLGNYPELAIASAVSEWSPDAATTMINEIIIRKDGTYKTFSENVLGLTQAAQIFNNSTTINDTVDKVTSTEELSNKQKSEVLGNFVDKFTTISESDSIPSSQVNSVILGNYSKDAQNDKLWNSVSPDQRPQLFYKMYSPKITENVFSKGSIEAQNTYVSSAINKFRDIPSIKSDTSQFMKAGNIGAKISVNEKTGLLEYNINDKYTGARRQSLDMVSDMVLGKQINDFNQGLKTLLPIFEKTGDDPQKTVLALLQSMGVDVNNPTQDTFLGMAAKALTRGIKKLDSTLDGEYNEANRFMDVGFPKLNKLYKESQDKENKEEKELEFMFDDNNPPTDKPSKRYSSLKGAESDIGMDIYNAAIEAGADPEYLLKTAHIESSLNPTAQASSSSAGGLFQFINSTAREVGLKNRFSVQESAAAASKLYVKNKKALENRLGRKVTNAELYLAHQQGQGGAIKLLKNPDSRAVDLVGRKAVLNNGGNALMTSRQFMKLIQRKYAKAGL